MKLQIKSGIVTFLLLASFLTNTAIADDSDMLMASDSTEEVTPLVDDEEVSVDDSQTYVPPAGTTATDTDNEEYSLEGEPSDSE
tara:strand:- start:162349 stop:162600 length:252 start_codon:yes stop_codon:yes gene_type:complete